MKIIKVKCINISNEYWEFIKLDDKIKFYIEREGFPLIITVEKGQEQLIKIESDKTISDSCILDKNDVKNISQINIEKLNKNLVEAKKVDRSFFGNFKGDISGINMSRGKPKKLTLEKEEINREEQLDEVEKTALQEDKQIDIITQSVVKAESVYQSFVGNFDSNIRNIDMSSNEDNLEEISELKEKYQKLSNPPSPVTQNFDTKINIGQGHALLGSNLGDNANFFYKSQDDSGSISNKTKTSNSDYEDENTELRKKIEEVKGTIDVLEEQNKNRKDKKTLISLIENKKKKLKELEIQQKRFSQTINNHSGNFTSQGVMFIASTFGDNTNISSNHNSVASGNQFVNSTLTATEMDFSQQKTVTTCQQEIPPKSN